MTKHNKDTDKFESPDIRKILFYNTKIIYKNNKKKKRLQILEALTTFFLNPLEIAFATSFKHIKHIQ